MEIQKHSNPRKQGDAGLGLAIAWFACNGFTVAIPLTDSQKYDLVVEKDNRLQRVSVKTTTFRACGNFVAGLRVIGSNMRRTKITPFSADDAELVFIACGDGSRYIIPSKDIASTHSVTLNKKYNRYKLRE
jgi:hypothetical protein